jgi:hypothetical protein
MADKLITPELVVGAWEHLEDHFGSRRLRKTAPEMAMVAQLLEQMGILDAEDFLARYTTTLGRSIYTPWEVGEGRNLLGQLMVGCHEHQHVHQFISDPINHTWRYGTDSALRAAYEADAFRCNQEIMWWGRGRVPDPEATASNLEDYGCSKTDIVVTTKALRSSAITAKAGGIVSAAGKVLIPWLEEHTA